ncbi:hypothetical protein K7X08_036960 [Anisodus acutangulus]|uniref:Uncharacterized protein n=1 Tax=Anisodus acutangulus TaxID=402998 RepID=A0A9Q1QVC3_9SOLA|nr:hypothetical protein K7X08_036960 [Anisodus acutangulus]
MESTQVTTTLMATVEAIAPAIITGVASSKAMTEVIGQDPPENTGNKAKNNFGTQAPVSDQSTGDASNTVPGLNGKISDHTSKELNVRIEGGQSYAAVIGQHLSRKSL